MIGDMGPKAPCVHSHTPLGASSDPLLLASTTAPADLCSATRNPLGSEFTSAVTADACCDEPGSAGG